MLIADRDLLVTVNHEAAQIFEQAREVFGREDFNRPACVDFLLENYQMSRREAERQTRSMLVFGLRQGLVLKRYVVDSL